MKEGVGIDVWSFYQPLTDDFSDARGSGAARVRIDVAGGLYSLVSYMVTHDSNPPQGVEKLDQTLRSGLGWNF